jgi:hypothetical protein
MAVIAAGTGAVRMLTDGLTARLVVVGLRDVTTGDTVDLGPAGMDLLGFINRAVLMSVTSFVEIAATWNTPGTVVTMPAGLANDAAFLMAWGSGIN